MIGSITFAAGRVPGESGETVETTPLTIFIGPNNSGKSLVLKEIADHCTTGGWGESRVLQGLSFDVMPSDVLEGLLKQLEIPFGEGETRYPEQLKVGHRGHSIVINTTGLRDIWQDPNGLSKHQYATHMMRYLTLPLDGATRLKIFENQHSGDLQAPRAENLLQAVFRDPGVRSELRRVSHAAFDAYFVLDPTGMSMFRARLSKREPEEGEEIGIDPRALKFHSESMPLDQASDGVNAFLGIYAEVLAGGHKIILVDEPEAFLHPGLAYLLGMEIAKAAGNSGKKIFASTHSAPFLMGCIQAGVPINIVRLTYQGGSATARVLRNDELADVMKHPLLRSSNLLNGLFYQAVVVGESDSDRAFYQEVNERLLSSKPEWGIRNCLFLNAQNKDTIRTLLGPLRKLGIPAAGVVDIDFLKRETNWPDLYPSIALPEARRRSLNALRETVRGALEATGINMKTGGGISVLEKDDLEAANSLLDQLGEYGLFLVPNGELESWLKSLNVPGHGPNWLIGMLTSMGTDPTTEEYVVPSDNDVWRFMSKIKDWCANPERKGIPD